MFKEGLQSLSCIILRKTKSRLDRLDILPLSFRREISDLIYFFNCTITHFNIDRYVSFNVTQGRPTTRLSSDPYMLTVPRYKTESHNYFYFQRIVPIWNQLHLAARSAISLSLFKSQVSQFYRTKFSSSFSVDNICTWMSFCHCSLSVGVFNLLLMLSFPSRLASVALQWCNGGGEGGGVKRYII